MTGVGRVGTKMVLMKLDDECCYFLVFCKYESDEGIVRDGSEERFFLLSVLSDEEDGPPVKNMKLVEK
ncbi:hypothetical protein RJT34_11873 [Clitoria ternatea]|uniref:Uncharacterized protein n=1 Tax=Clitoria ternatea TaxID=43366 RepID=A0AAN9JNE3_CLITE